ncbi:MAG TPA: hypothetical protein VMH28_09135 [Candidatus Acidoferrales bacterium]|nr:hypothetical protein [Candidatus Acidoferrales bacterium]
MEDYFTDLIGPRTGPPVMRVVGAAAAWGGFWYNGVVRGAIV